MNILINKYREHAIPLICLSVLVCLFVTSQITLRDFPNSADEYSYLISAKLFSAGRLSVPSPSHKKFYDFKHIINDGQFYGKYSPGWPFFLMFGEFLGFPWVINMIFAVLTLVVMYSLARELFSEKIAKISLLLMATNSYFLFNSSSYFSHTSSQFFLLLFVYFYLKSLKTKKSGGWFLLGIILGTSFLIRQLEAVVFGFCIFIHYIYFVLRNKKACSGEFVKWGLFLSGFSLLFGIFLTYNYLQTGDPFLLPFIKYDPGDKLGFHYPYMTSFKSAIMDNIIYRIIHLNLWVPFCFVFMFLALFSSERYSKEYVYLMVALFISILFAYVFYVFHPGNQYGPRYLYSSSFTIFILMAIGIEKIMTSKWYGYRWVLPGILTLNIGLFIYVSVLFANQVDMRMELYDKVKESHISNTIVFLESPSGYMPVQDLTRNGIYFNNSVLFVKNFHQENRILMEDFPLRKYYLWRCEDRSINCTLKRIDKNLEVIEE
jgi:Dolichyl-phosphate-mannose-protein mannosyltransferase